jgi:hypothetical protein
MDLLSLRNAMLRTLINGRHCGAGICCLHLHGRRVCRDTIYQATWDHVLEKKSIPIFPNTKVLNLKKFE